MFGVADILQRCNRVVTNDYETHLKSINAAKTG